MSLKKTCTTYSFVTVLRVLNAKSNAFIFKLAPCQPLLYRSCRGNIVFKAAVRDLIFTVSLL